MTRLEKARKYFDKYLPQKDKRRMKRYKRKFRKITPTCHCGRDLDFGEWYYMGSCSKCEEEWMDLVDILMEGGEDMEKYGTDLEELPVDDDQIRALKKLAGEKCVIPKNKKEAEEIIEKLSSEE